MSKFQRENRYIVIKRTDLKKVPITYRRKLVDPMFALLAHLPNRSFVVVESDWPEFEPVWRMIEARVTGVVPEVMRWPLKGVLPGVEGISKAVLKPVVVLASDYDALAAQRDEGLARETELIDAAEGYRVWGGGMRLERDALQQRLAKAEKKIDDAADLLRRAKQMIPVLQYSWHANTDALLSSRGCADGEAKPDA